MKSKEQPNKPQQRKLIIAAAVIIGIGLIGLIGYTWWRSATVNYAQEVVLNVWKTHC
jgi:flagellar basal body-associated protein FliL